MIIICDIRFTNFDKSYYSSKKVKKNKNFIEITNFNLKKTKYDHAKCLLTPQN